MKHSFFSYIHYNSISKECKCIIYEHYFRPPENSTPNLCKLHKNNVYCENIIPLRSNIVEKACPWKSIYSHRTRLFVIFLLYFSSLLSGSCSCRYSSTSRGRCCSCRAHALDGNPIIPNCPHIVVLCAGDGRSVVKCHGVSV